MLKSDCYFNWCKLIDKDGEERYIFYLIPCDVSGGTRGWFIYPNNEYKNYRLDALFIDKAVKEHRIIKLDTPLPFKPYKMITDIFTRID